MWNCVILCGTQNWNWVFGNFNSTEVCFIFKGIFFYSNYSQISQRQGNSYDKPWNINEMKEKLSRPMNISQSDSVARSNKTICGNLPLLGSALCLMLYTTFMKKFFLVSRMNSVLGGRGFEILWDWSNGRFVNNGCETFLFLSCTTNTDFLHFAVPIYFFFLIHKFHFIWHQLTHQTMFCHVI